MCDVVPPGKTYEETCGKSPKGWQPLNEALPSPSLDLLPKTFQELYWYSQSTCETANERSCRVLGCLKPYGEIHREQCKEFAWLPEKNIVPSPTQSSSDIPADWKIYRSEEYRFEFKHPLEISISPLQLVGGVSAATIMAPNNVNGVINISSGPHPYGATPLSTENIDLDGVPAKIEIYDLPSPNPSFIPPSRKMWVTFKQESNEFLFDITYPTSNDQSQLFKEIFSTFQFTTP